MRHGKQATRQGNDLQFARDPAAVTESKDRWSALRKMHSRGPRSGLRLGEGHIYFKYPPYQTLASRLRKGLSTPGYALYYRLLLPLYRSPALSIQLQQMRGVLLRFRSRARPLKTHARRGGPPISRGHGDKFHQIERDILIAARTPMRCWTFFHKSFS